MQRCDIRDLLAVKLRQFTPGANEGPQHIVIRSDLSTQAFAAHVEQFS